MEASDCVYGGYYRAGGPQFVGSGQEKKAGGGGGDHFLVEDLLDFSNEEEAEDNGVFGGDDGGFEAEAEAKGGNSTGSSTVTAVDSCNSSFSGGVEHHFSGDLACLSGDLCEPYEELAELEWLSNFVEEDSFSSEDLQKFQLISGVQSASGPGSVSSSSDTPGSSSSIEIPSSASPGGKLTAPIQQQPAPLFLPEATAVPGKARSKRSRTAPNNWSSRLLVLCPNAASAASPPSDSDSILLNPNPVRKAPKPGKRREIPPLMAPSDGRRCLHCATDRTPQWRTGPMGPKTLCNACGVRYKSGRLVPEYRPAASPTFVLSKHSNSHRKVLELRRQKDLQQQFVHPGGPGPVFDRSGPASASAEASSCIHHRLGPDFRQLI